jgi:ribosome recycling factor
MSDRISNEKKAKQFARTICSLINQDPLKPLKKNLVSSDLINFSKRDEVQELTNNYTKELFNLWKNKHKKQLKETSDDSTSIQLQGKVLPIVKTKISRN